jgi:hypothetical protein
MPGKTYSFLGAKAIQRITCDWFKANVTLLHSRCISVVTPYYPRTPPGIVRAQYGERPELPYCRQELALPYK